MVGGDKQSEAQLRDEKRICGGWILWVFNAYLCSLNCSKENYLILKLLHNIVKLLGTCNYTVSKNIASHDLIVVSTKIQRSPHGLGCHVYKAYKYLIMTWKLPCLHGIKPPMAWVSSLQGTQSPSGLGF